MTRARLELRGIQKSFGAVIALRSIDLALPAGTIHGILGENGAGKSTLVAIVAGNVPPDSGTVLIDGAPLAPDPRAAHDAGIAVVHQHFALIGPLSVAENLRLGRPDPPARVVSPAKLIAEARAAAAQHRLDIGDPGARCDTLPVGAQARVEILRALRETPKILLLDEPTAVLTPSETADFFTTLRDLRAAGLLVVFITHKVAEALEICDAITVLRQGAVVATVDAATTSAEDLAALIVGGDSGNDDDDRAPALAPHKTTARDTTARHTTAHPTPERRESVLEVRGLAATGPDVRVPLRDLGFELRAGEICGVAGVDGNGQEELAGALYGLVERTGTVRVGGETVRGGDVVAAQRAGIVLVPPDRRRDGLALGLPVWENAILAEPLVARFARYGLLDRSAARTFATDVAREYRVGRGDPDQSTAALSGGNQQRLVIGRAMALEPVVLVAVNPTRGLDLTATAHVHAVFRRAAAAGVAVLLISSELDELAALCDRSFVLYRGRLLGPVGASDRLRVGQLMAGVPA